MNDYLSVVYNEYRTPRTEYPFMLVAYLCNRFNLQKGIKLLEIGCGRLEFLECFQKMGLDCHGVDIAQYSSSNLENFKIEKVDVSKDPFPYENNSFDIIYHKSLIEHLYTPDHLMLETYRILKPRGRLIILTPDWISQMKVFYEDYTHCRPYDIKSLSDILQTHGFNHVKTEHFYQLPVIWRHPRLKIISRFLQLILTTTMARRLTDITGVSFFRWSVELMILGTGIK